ncbi:g4671 [Coccomyxa elongata]
MGLYKSDGSLKDYAPRVHGNSHPQEERISRKSRRAEVAPDAEDFVIPAGYVAKDPDAQPTAKPGTEERVKVTLCSSLTVGDGDGSSSGLSPTREADGETLGARGLSEAKKAFLYDTSVELGEAADSSAADDAAATKVLSQMKQLELSGSVGSILLPTVDTAEPSPPCRASRRGYVAAQLRNNSSFIFGDDASLDAPGPAPDQATAGRRQPPGGTSSFSVGW